MHRALAGCNKNDGYEDVWTTEAAFFWQILPCANV